MLKTSNYSTNSRALSKFAFSNAQKKWLTTILMLFIAFIALSDPAFAEGFGKIDDALKKIVEALTGAIAKSIATIAVAGVGLAWIAGYVEMRKAFFVCVGIGIVMGASQIVSMLSN
ncbi:TrbC/VirB2 family protein [Bartonella sp. ML70XJBT.G]|uniref:TrbC/VirB2 family protein n=1 Tax=Bartonella sp. ML70XJBT.G TaxID=3019093 RepID=UPI0023624C93|nr:TrbC/VirB2 family protein [Bartonella sp. ML70XJBT.G]